MDEMFHAKHFYAICMCVCIPVINIFCLFFVQQKMHETVFLFICMFFFLIIWHRDSEHFLLTDFLNIICFPLTICFLVVCVHIHKYILRYTHTNIQAGRQAGRQTVKCHDVIKCPSMNHETNFTE